MSTCNNVENILKIMVELLDYGTKKDWAATIEKARVKFENSPRAMSSELLVIYGGTGSINDIVLHKEGRVLVAENDEFDLSREQLYEICKKIR